LVVGTFPTGPLNAIFKATTVSSSRGTLEAIPIDELLRILEKHPVLGWNTSQRP